MEIIESLEDPAIVRITLPSNSLHLLLMTPPGLLSRSSLSFLLLSDLSQTFFFCHTCRCLCLECNLYLPQSLLLLPSRLLLLLANPLLLRSYLCLLYLPLSSCLGKLTSLFCFVRSPDCFCSLVLCTTFLLLMALSFQDFLSL